MCVDRVTHLGYALCTTLAERRGNREEPRAIGIKLPMKTIVVIRSKLKGYSKSINDIDVLH